MAHQMAVFRATVLENPYIPVTDLRPSPKQARFLAYLGQEALFGGSAGGGKSDALLMAALQYVDVPGYSALILRRTFRHLQMDGGLIPRSKEWLLGKPGVRWNAQLMQWTFPSGATLSFGYYDHDDHYMLYQGGNWQFVGWDEATQFKPSWYRYLFSRTRRLKDSPVPVRVRAASNPGGPSHEFFKRRFISKGASKFFVPSRLHDNPGLDAAEYVKSLAELDPITRAQLLQGDWDAYEGGRFKAEWFREFAVWQNADGGYRYHLQVGERPDGTPVFEPEGIPCDRCFNVTVVDPAARAEDANDYTAILTVAQTPCKRLLILDMVRERIPLERIVPRIAEVCAGFSPLWVGIEADSFQAYIANDARKCEGIPAVHNLSHECKAKLVRATPAIIRANAGQIYVPERGPSFPWVEDFLAELAQFTGDEKNDSHDDQVDALAHVCNALDRFGLSGPVAVEPDPDPADDNRGEWDHDGEAWGGWSR